jgi:hypothetical protein
MQASGCSTLRTRRQAVLSATIHVLALGLAVSHAAPRPAFAQAPSDAQWTVLTVSRDGAWGVATAPSQGEAVDGAWQQCRSKASEDNDCGAELLAYRRGWSVGILCGVHRVLATAQTFAEIEHTVERRLRSLKEHHDLPPCRRVLTVDPFGAVTPGRLPVAER